MNQLALHHACAPAWGFDCTLAEYLCCTAAAPVTLEQLQHLQNLLQRTQGAQPGVNTQLQGVCVSAFASS